MYGLFESAQQRNSKKNVNIMRLIFLVLWIGIALFISLKYTSYVRFAMIWRFSIGLLFLYYGTVSSYLSHIRERRYKKISHLLFLVIFSSTFILISLFTLSGIMKDIILGQIETREVYVVMTKTAIKGAGKEVLILGDPKLYSQSRGNVSLEEGSTYIVNILPNSEIIIGLEKK